MAKSFHRLHLHTLRAYDSNPVWTDDPQHMFFRDVARGARHAGYAGRLGKESAAVLADFIIVDMFGEVCTGQQTLKRRRSAPRNARGGTIGARAHLINVIPAQAGSSEHSKCVARMRVPQRGRRNPRPSDAFAFCRRYSA